MNALLIVVGIVFVVAGGISGSFGQMLRARRLHLRDASYGVGIENLRYIAGGIGGVAGVVIGSLAAYYLSLNHRVDFITWIGRFSYLLITLSVSGHILTLVHMGLHLWREEKAVGQRPVLGSSLSERRWQLLQDGRQANRHYIDFKSKDEEVMDGLVGFFAEPLLNARRDMARIPLYGYLGTVCGILLMAQELGQIDEASQTFKVLSSMAGGLALAFKTTLVALVSYLPLRKVVDYMLQRVALLENTWRSMREEDQ